MKQASLQDYAGLDAIWQMEMQRLHPHFNLNYKDLEYVVRLVLVPVCYRKDEVSFSGSLDLWILVRSVV